jgi:exodeoxyribonuclease VII large subunit
VEEDPTRERAEGEDPQPRIFPVGALLKGLSQLLEEQVGRLWVVGEVSNLHQAGSGHVYFSLKDDIGQVRAALFRAAARRVPFELEEGMEIVVYADVSIYAVRGDLQLIVRAVEPRGLGALQLAFEQLRRRLEAEGLFDAERKRALPAHPRRIGIVTSPTGAAIRDVIEVTGRRFPGTPLMISPTRVQGAGSEREIAAALERATSSPGCEDVDLVMVVRGGGSLEDLWSFNSEIVARAIAGCPVPVISGVGHEVDVTIADLVADVRAATPSAAAMLALPERDGLRVHLERDWRRLRSAGLGLVRAARQRLARESDALRVLAPSARLAAQRSRLRSASHLLARELASGLERHRAALAGLAARLESLSPLAVLARGYALVRRHPDGEIVRRAQQVVAGERLRVQLSEGRLDVRVDSDAGDTPAA